METGFLNFHDEEHFSDFSLSLEQHLMEKPQDLLMHIVENDFDYMETHLDIANSDSLWSNEHERSEDADEITEIPTISKTDNIKEDFAKVLTDWQEHIGYLQATDIDEYMDIIGLNMNSTDRKSFCISENVFQDEQSTQTLESEYFRTKQVDLKKECLQSSQNIQEPNIENNSYCKISDTVKNCDKHVEIESKSLPTELMYRKSQNKVKKNILKYDSIVIDITSNIITKQKRKKKEKSLLYNKDVKSSNHDNSKPHLRHLPVLEAGTVESLLEQFEASENTAVSSNPSSKNNTDVDQDLSLTRSKNQQCMKEPRINATEKPLSQVSSLHKNIRDALPKEIIDKVKTSGCKKVISIIPTMSSSIQTNGRSNGTRMQDAAATLSRNKLLQIVTNSTKSRAIDGGLVQLDHDYCSSTNSSISSSDSNYEYDKQSSDTEKVTPVKNDDQQWTESHSEYTKHAISLLGNEILVKRKGYSIENSTKKDDTLELIEVSANSEEQVEAVVFEGDETSGSVKRQSETKCEKQILTEDKNCQNVNASNNTTKYFNQIRNESSNNSTPEMKIRSALATSILQLQRGALSKTKCLNGGNQKTKQMVSVLKKPLNVQQSPAVITSSYESIVTTHNRSNDKIQNIIVQNTEEKVIQEEDRKPPRKKLNLAEYRSRREQNRSDNSRTNSPIQPMALIYIHHASTTTEPIKDDFGSLNWSEREIVSVLKPKVDVDEEKAHPKPLTCDVGIQTYETVFEFPPKSLTDIDERHEDEREKHVLNTSQRSYRKHRIGSSSSRSRSRSKSKSRSKSRSSSSSRDRSHKRSNTRHRRISHRRSSVSSSSSWSSRSRSRSRSNTRSTFSSESRYSRSRSRSSRSRSRSSSRYSSCSRFSSRSSFGRSKWLSRKRKERRSRKDYDRHRQRSSSSYRSYRDWRRSPSSSYRKSYDWFDREKQRQVEERRVIYVGRLEEGITKADLRRRFENFGPVVDISVHFREHGDNYGFVTFGYKNDAYEAVEHGNDDPTLPRYDLCFGGRRAFCKVKYADLDGMASSSPNSGHMSHNQMNEDNTFDLLLKEAKAKLRKRKV
ncbi:PREDICTED: NK-tumor recognition protein [Dufourea novaeangliae]|uniref:NK-tumor recognition protein n=1 Tax=Dufourea novaeangliae TaxID=178035 RepID=UPI0007678653|nr:PREDICTED: NK-tumor recognition protein [Dufourea novaeangliae]